MTVQEFLFDLPLYKKVQREKCEDIIKFLTRGGIGKHKVDGYNPIEQCDSTFTLFCGIYYTVQNSVNDPVGLSPLEVSFVSGKSEKFNTYEVILKCKRYGTFLHYLVHAEYAEDDYEHNCILTLSKVGQYPSVADIHLGQVHKYDKVLPRDKMREFTKAIGLAANGVGIGSFVYLRRIFEYLVFEAKNIAKANIPEFNEAEFTSARMNERIQMLSDYLPDFLVEHHNIYSILSKGVHELSEEECKKYFTVLKESIEIILDEKLEAYNKERHKKAIGNAIAEITGAIK